MSDDQRKSPGDDAKGFRLWDLPTRLFHWALVILIAMQWATAEYELLPMDWHFRFGYAILTLLLFRLCWGFLGSQSARFASFLKSPLAVLRYARAIHHRAPEHRAGHNPLGGWSVIALLFCLGLQLATGLFAFDDVLVAGPFAAHVSVSASELLTEIHEYNKNVLLALIGLHVFAVLWHLLVKRENLVVPMVTGRKALPMDPALRFASVARAALIFAICAAAVWALVTWSV